MECYLDNAATTRVLDQAREAMLHTMEKDFGNPSSLHRKGMEAEAYIRRARENLSSLLKAEPGELIFTSGGTESNNLALIGTAMANRRSGCHIITSSTEHASVYNPLLFLEENGFRVTYLPVDSLGRVSREQLLEAVEEDTILVSIMYVNNEIGTLQDISGLSAAVKQKKPEVLFHSDAIQGFGKFRIYPKREGIDLLSVSGHKLHGPKGSGLLFVKDKVKIKPILFGGGQQGNMRSGTENVPAAAGFSAAAAFMYREHENKMERLYQLKYLFLTELVQVLPDTAVHGLAGADTLLIELPEGQRLEALLHTCAPHILSLGFAGVRSEVLLHALEDKGIYVSSGSACSSHHPGVSGTLRAIGCAKEYLDATLRFSFSVFTAEDEIHYTVKTLGELVPFLRRFQRR